MDETAFAKWIIDQGGVFAILLVVLFFYRRDFADVRTNLTRIVEQNIAAMEQVKASNDKLTLALNHNTARRREHDEEHEREREREQRERDREQREREQREQREQDRGRRGRGDRPWEK